MILLYKKKIPLNFVLLYGFLSFWNTLANAFCLPFDMMSPTLHDVAAIVDLLVDRDEVPSLHNILNTDLGFYSTFINTFNMGSDLIGENEHKAFLLFWVCKFFVCTSSIVIVAEFAPYVSAILNRSYFNINRLFLLLLYKGIFTIMF